MATTHLASLAALLIVLVAAEASIYRTTVTTIVNSDSSSSQQCHKQIQGQKMKECWSFVQSGQQQFSASPQQTPPQECCEKLRNVDTECRCEMINKMWREMQQQDTHQLQGEQQQQQQEQMKMKAQFLPAMCQMEPQVCMIEQTSVYVY